MKDTAGSATETRSPYIEPDMTTPVIRPFAGGVTAVFSTRCPGKPTPCEDYAALLPCALQSGVLVVADGMGGQPAGDQAARLAVSEIERGVAAAEDIDLREVILNGFEAANRRVCGMTVAAATTLAVVEIQGRSVRPYHVGDSMILVVGQRGKIKLQTVSHSPVGYAVEAGFLDQEEAMLHADRHLISNMIGSQEMHITIGPPLKLADRDTLIVASDGLSDNLHLHEIIARVRKGPLDRVARCLQEETHQRMDRPIDGRPSKPDDLTFVIFRPSLPVRHKASPATGATES
jgi:serine/threonine protein phosphatase PrpC